MNKKNSLVNSDSKCSKSTMHKGRGMLADK